MEQTNKNTALLVMDVQTVTVNMLQDANAPLLSSIAESIKAARNNNIPVIYVVVGFRKGYPEVSPANKSFSGLKASGWGLDTEEAMRIDAAVAPQPGEVTMIKKRVSAFAGSDLEVVLRSNSIQHIVLMGISTSGVVLSTVREASDKDYQITVLSDCCADPDEEVHNVLLTKVFPRQAGVIGHQQWIDSI
ncbi:MAG TPA: isochorismatase family cysteine hydrolase [Mucilaginibacter sp.]|jgi:nicotinamidase-related amidase